MSDLPRRVIAKINHANRWEEWQMDRHWDIIDVADDRTCCHCCGWRMFRGQRGLFDDRLLSLFCSELCSDMMRNRDSGPSYAPQALPGFEDAAVPIQGLLWADVNPGRAQAAPKGHKDLPGQGRLFQ